VGLYEIVEFTKITKDSTNLHDNKYHPQRYLQGGGQTYSYIFSPYSGISSHSFGHLYS
jgi:hypothetical protein